MRKNYKFLNDINFPSDLRKVSENNLQKVADEVREEMIECCFRNRRSSRCWFGSG